MDSLEETYKGKRILVTGASGFKGSYLTLWLRKMGAKVYCASLPPHTQPNHYDLLGYGNEFPFIDLRNYLFVKEIVSDFKPEIMLHLAAKAIVKESFRDPWGTFGSNIMSAVNVLEACRLTPSVKAIVMITSDKVYKDWNWRWPYREADELAGTDPYSASKVCVEYVAASYRESFNMNIATARAGNVVGGADWGAYRLIPDIMRATAEGKPVEIHTPHATRPYQHVLEALHGYLMLGAKLLEPKEKPIGGSAVVKYHPVHNDYNSAFNFGPDGSMSVLEVLEVAQKVWPKIRYVVKEEETHPGMVNLLKIDSTKAKQMLGWKPRWTMQEAVERAVIWYRDWYQDGIIHSLQDIKSFEEGL